MEQEDLLFEELLEQDIAPKIDCDQCLLIPNAFCLAESRNDPNSVRMPFDDMIETMTEKKSVCTCSDGYLPVFDDDGILSRCHDPIMATAIIGKVFFSKMLQQRLCHEKSKDIIRVCFWKNYEIKLGYRRVPPKTFEAT